MVEGEEICAGCVLKANPRLLAMFHHQRRVGRREAEGPGLSRGIHSASEEGSPEPPFPPHPARATTSPSIARSGRGKGEKKKKFGPSIPGMRFLLARSGGRAGRSGRGGARRGGRGAARPEPGARTRAGPGPSMAEPLLRKTFSRLRGREKLPRKKSDAKERGEPGRRRRRGRRTPPGPGGGPGAPGRDGLGGGGGVGESPAESPEARGGGPRAGRGPGGKGLGRGRGGADRYVRLAGDASAAGSLGGPGGGPRP